MAVRGSLDVYVHGSKERLIQARGCLPYIDGLETARALNKMKKEKRFKD